MRKLTTEFLSGITTAWYPATKGEARAMAREILSLRDKVIDELLRANIQKGKREMPKVITITDGAVDTRLEVWTDLTRSEIAVLPGVDYVLDRCRSSGRRLSVYCDPRYGREFVKGALTQAANAKAEADKD